MHTTLVFPLVVIHVTSCTCLQFISSSQNHPSDVFGSSRAHGSPSDENTIVIQSKAYNVTNDNESIKENTQLRKNIYVQKEENTQENYSYSKQPQYAIDCGDDKACLEAHGIDSPEPTFKPYTQEELEKLLAQYAESHGKPPEIDDDSPTNKLANLYMDEEEAVINVLESNPKNNELEKSKSASWQLLNSQKHNHPYDDHQGWVTLEPVPWAQSQIQKWEPNVKPQIPTWDSSQSHHHPSHWDTRPSHEYSTERPWSKPPSYDYKPSRPQWSQWTRPNDFPERPATTWGGNPDIITDNHPGYFPGPPPSQRPWYDQESYSSNRPTQVYEDRPLHHSHLSRPSHPSTHPSEGEGQWVLLSSTKGYSTPHRHRGQYQRSFNFNAKAPTASLSSHRTVRLTVLPAENSTNTTLSHGGLLEVESTLQTVEEAQREHAAKMLKLKTLSPEDLKTTPPPVSAVRTNSRRSNEDIQVFSASPAQPESKTAILAAIGAGMIPATMAMMLPMVLGRRKRSINHDLSAVNNTQLYNIAKLQHAKRFTFIRNHDTV